MRMTRHGQMTYDPATDTDPRVALDIERNRVVATSDPHCIGNLTLMMEKCNLLDHIAELGSSDRPYAILAAGGVFTAANDAFCRMLGYDMVRDNYLICSVK